MCWVRIVQYTAVLKTVIQLCGSVSLCIRHLIGIAMMSARVHDFNFGKRCKKILIISLRQ